MGVQPQPVNLYCAPTLLARYAGRMWFSTCFMPRPPGCEDRVACHACGKVLFNWDPDDEILDAHRLFSPDCALVTGKPLEPLPEEGAADDGAKPAWAAAASIAPGTAGESITANLSSFVETLRQTASSVDVEDLVKRAKV